MSRARDRADGKITGNVLPSGNETFSLGSSSARFNDGYFAASTVDIGGLAISKDTNGDAEFKDGSGAFKKIMASEIHLGTGASKAVMKRQSDGTVGFATTDNSGNSTAASVGSSTTVVANASNLPTSPSDGDLAFAADTSRLYLSRNNAWYSVALVNTAPSISGNSATYELATDGTATVVTMTGTDPEGDPITWTSSASGLGSIATVSQGSGASTNVFTITPSTNTAHGGTFSVSFQASDGVNSATATSTFTLVFSSPMARGSKMLMKTSGNNGRTNSVFDDSSSSNHTLTANGNVFQSSHSPYSVPDGFWSYVFTGSNYLRATDCEALGSADFTIEFFMKGNNTSGYKTMFESRSSGSNGFGIGVNPSNTLYLYHTGFNYTSSVALPVNEWCHVALVGDGTANTVSYYQDGRYIGAWSIDYNFTSTQFTIGTDPDAGADNYVGRLSNVRVSNSKRYTANFKIPIEPFTTDSNTKVLTCQSVILKENSGNTRTWVKTGVLTIKPDAPSPFIIPDVWKEAVGGSAYFDGSGDYIAVPNSTDFTMTGDFTAECWHFATANKQLAGIIAFQSDGESNGFALVQGANTSKYHINVKMVSTDSASDIVLNTWNHVALVRSGTGSGNVKLYINGVADGNTITQTATVTKISNPSFGRPPGFTSRDYVGWIADARISDVARYTSNFTPPTAPTAVDSNTKLKVNFTQAGMFDSAAIHSLKPEGSVTESTAQTKYATTSTYFNGAYISETNDNLIVRQGDMQIQFWLYMPSISGNEGYFHCSPNPAGSSTDGFCMYHSAAGTIYLYHGPGGSGWTQSSTMPTGQWVHHVYLRRNGRIQHFQNGVRQVDVANTADWTGNVIHIGNNYSGNNHLTGYMEDFQFLNGHTTYPNERPQTALTAPTGTVLQLANASTIPSSPNGLTLSVGAGSPTVSSFTPPDSTVTHSIRYDGNDRTDIASHANLTFGTGDFTIEAYVYLVSQATSYASILDWRHSSQNDASAISLTYDSSKLYIYNAGFLVNNLPRTLGKWQHLVFQRRTISGTSTNEFYIDGILLHSAANTTNWTASTLKIGSSMWADHGDFFISDLRVNKGNAIYSSTFTPPTASL